MNSTWDTPMGAPPPAILRQHIAAGCFFPLKRGQKPNFCPLDRGYFLLEISVEQTLQCLAVAGLVASHFVDGLQNAAFQAAYLQGRGWLICIDILSFQRKLRNIFLLEMCELSFNFGTSLVLLPNIFLTSFVQF